MKLKKCIGGAVEGRENNVKSYLKSKLNLYLSVSINNPGKFFFS